MSFNARYHLIVYNPDINKFHIRKGQNKIFTSADTEAIISYYESKLSFGNRELARLLQKGLNDAIKNSQQNYDKLVGNIINKLASSDIQKLIDKGYIIKDRNLTLDRTKLNKKRYENEFKKIVQQIFPNDNIVKETNVSLVIQKLQGHLNTIRGDIFELLNTDMLENVSNQVMNLSDTTLDDFIEQVQKNINKYSKGSANPIKKIRQNATTTGANLKSNLSLLVEGDEITIKGAKGKSDVTISGLSGDIDALGFSMKNYANIRYKISILSSANVPGLIATWPTSNDIKNLAINSLSGRDTYLESFNIMKNIFMLQGMAGTSNEDILSSFLIFSSKNEETPILVFSIYDILFEGGMDDKKKEFGGDFSSTGMPIETETGARTEADFLNFINSAKLSIKTNMSLSRMIKNYSNNGK